MITKVCVFKVKIRFLQLGSLGVNGLTQYSWSGRLFVDGSHSGVVFANVGWVRLIAEDVAVSVLGSGFEIGCEGLFIQLKHLLLHLFVRDSFLATLLFQHLLDLLIL